MKQYSSEKCILEQKSDEIVLQVENPFAAYVAALRAETFEYPEVRRAYESWRYT